MYICVSIQAYIDIDVDIEIAREEIEVFLGGGIYSPNLLVVFQRMLTILKREGIDSCSRSKRNKMESNGSQEDILSNTVYAMNMKSDLHG